MSALRATPSEKSLWALFINQNLRFGLAGLIFLDFDFRMKLYRTGEVSYYKVGEQQGYSR
jgi:hypothetical protein